MRWIPLMGVGMDGDMYMEVHRSSKFQQVFAADEQVLIAMGMCAIFDNLPYDGLGSDRGEHGILRSRKRFVVPPGEAASRTSALGVPTSSFSSLGCCYSHLPLPPRTTNL